MTPWVKRLIAANVVMYFVSLLDPVIPRALLLIPAQIPLRPWTIVTYMFLHAGLLHIFFNMLMLFFFGPRLEAKLGGQRFLTLYLVSGFLGALLSLFTPQAAIVGASGAVYGVMAAFALLWPREKVLLYFLFPIEIRVLMVAFVALSVFFVVTGGNSGIAHFAHLGGFLGGWVSLKWFDRTSPARRFRQRAAPSPTAASATDVRRWNTIPRNDLHPVNRDELDRVLDKISASGMESLTAAERAFLDRFSRS